MFGVMDFHRTRVDVRFERIIGISKFWKFKSHEVLLRVDLIKLQNNFIPPLAEAQE